MLLLKAKRLWYSRKTDHPGMLDFLHAPLPSAGESMAKTPFLSVDLETTSLNPELGEVASFGWVPIDDGCVQLAGAEHHFVAVQKGVGQSAIFHQISDSQLSEAEPIRVIAEQFLKAARGRVLVFHNTSLDMGFINTVFRKLFAAPLPVLAVDTMRLEHNKLLAHQEGLEAGSLRLFACRQRYGLPDYPAHDALTDAIATAELLLAQMAHRGSDSVLSDLLKAGS